MDRTIVSLALLKAQWELNQHDYLDTFAPFVVECLRLSEYMAVSLPQLKEGYGEAIRFDHSAKRAKADPESLEITGLYQSRK